MNDTIMFTFENNISSAKKQSLIDLIDSWSEIDGVGPLYVGKLNHFYENQYILRVNQNYSTTDVLEKLKTICGIVAYLPTERKLSF